MPRNHHSRDIVDTPGIALPTLVELCLLLARSPCPIYTVPGNHDLWGGSPDTVDRTPYGALTRFGLIRDLSRGLYPVDGVLLTGHGYDADTDRDLAQYMPHTPLEPSSQQSCRTSLHHSSLLRRSPSCSSVLSGGAPPQQAAFYAAAALVAATFRAAHSCACCTWDASGEGSGHALSRYTLASDVAAQNEAPDVLVVGHEHAGFGVLRIGRTTFVNPGALCRLSASTVEMARQIRVCLLTLSAQAVEGPGRGIETELLPIESAQPGLEVLSRAHLHETGSSFSRADAFVALLEAEIVEDPLEIDKVIDEVAAAHGLPKEVVDEAIRRVAEASESLGYASSVW